MKQRALFPHRPQNRQTQAGLADRYAVSNHEAAEIILRDRERYAGLPVMWAEVLLQSRTRVTEWRLTA
jgi:hypothetical protein